MHSRGSQNGRTAVLHSDEGGAQRARHKDVPSEIPPEYPHTRLEVLTETSIWVPTSTSISAIWPRPATNATAHTSSAKTRHTARLDGVRPSPYATAGHAIDIQVRLQHPDIDNLTSADITLQFGPAAVSEELDTWKDVYGIEERYKAKLCGENDGKVWLMQVLDEWQADGKPPSDFLATLARQTQR